LLLSFLVQEVEDGQLFHRGIAAPQGRAGRGTWASGRRHAV
jgi:hypothetical protein